jgi:hypothetical protein
MLKDTGFQQSSAQVYGFWTRGSLGPSQQPINKLTTDKTLFEGGEMVAPVLNQVGPITPQSERVRERGGGEGEKRVEGEGGSGEKKGERRYKKERVRERGR